MKKKFPKLLNPFPTPRLAHALYESRSKGFFNKLTDMEIFSRLKLTIGVNPLTQLPELSFEIKESQTKQSFASLLDWIATEQNVLIIFDGFQQILSYPQKNTEGFLRSEMMRLPNVRFIFCGSDQHLLDEMFRSHSRPFFNSTQVMGMEEIHSDSYSSFIKKHFKNSKRTISDDAIAYVLHVTGNETYSVQKICNAIFESNIPNATLPIVKEIFKKVLIEQQSYFERIRILLKADSVQFKLLRAIAKRDIILEPTGKEFMSSNGFTNSSSVLKALKSLESYSLVSKVIVENKRLGYYINDALFRAWLSTLPV